MIDRMALQSLSPRARASLIYGEAKAATNARLWQAALGRSESGSDGGSFAPRRIVPLSDEDDVLQSLQSLAQQAVRPHAARVAAPPTDILAATVERTPDLPRTHGPGGPGNLGSLGANARYETMISAAAQRTGLPPAALASIIDAEAGKARDGSWQVHSRNPRSSAAGLGQFLSRTWEGLAETKGTWLNATARAHGWLDGAGKVVPAARAPLLALRYTPDAAIEGVADFARRNLAGMKRAGVSADGEVGATARLAYLCHHLGPGDAVRFLRDGGLAPDRARRLLTAQIGAGDCASRIERAGDARTAHRDWLMSYVDRKIRPQRYAA